MWQSAGKAIVLWTVKEGADARFAVIVTQDHEGRQNGRHRQYDRAIGHPRQMQLEKRQQKGDLGDEHHTEKGQWFFEVHPPDPFRRRGCWPAGKGRVKRACMGRGFGCRPWNA